MRIAEAIERAPRIVRGEVFGSGGNVAENLEPGLIRGRGWMPKGLGDGRGPAGRVPSMDHINLSHPGAERRDVVSAPQHGVLVAG